MVVVVVVVVVVTLVRSAGGGAGGLGGRRARHHQEERCEERRELRAPDAYARKLQSFCPTNESGVPATIAIACASTFIIPASTSSTSVA